MEREPDRKSNWSGIKGGGEGPDRLAQQDSWVKLGSADQGQELEGEEGSKEPGPKFGRGGRSLDHSQGSCAGDKLATETEASFRTSACTLDQAPSAALSERGGTVEAVPTDRI